MNSSIPAPPANSCFLLEEDPEGNPRLVWHPAKKGLEAARRWGAAAFIGFWLCGWAAGEVFAIAFLAGLLPGPGGVGGGVGWFGTLFLVGWLGAWTVGGLAAFYAFISLIRKPRPESIVFGINALRHDPGTSSIRYSRKGYPNTASDASCWRARKAREIPWGEITDIHLERVGERQRLALDYGMDRIEIGRDLREPEREWLAQTLRALVKLPNEGIGR